MFCRGRCVSNRYGAPGGIVVRLRRTALLGGCSTSWNKGAVVIVVIFADIYASHRCMQGNVEVRGSYLFE